MAFWRPFDGGLTRPRCDQGPGFSPGGFSKVRAKRKAGLAQTGAPPVASSAGVLSSETHPRAFCSRGTGHEKHVRSVQGLGSGKFSNPSGKVSFSPFTFFFPPTGKDFSFGTLPMQMAKTHSHGSGTEHFLLTGKQGSGRPHSGGRGPRGRGRRGASRGASAPPGSRSRHCVAGRTVGDGSPG